jgi:hypothetical protein
MNATVAAAQAACRRSAWNMRGLLIDVHDRSGYWDEVQEQLDSAIPLTAVESLDATPDISLEILGAPVTPPSYATSATICRGFGCRIVEDAEHTLICDANSWFLIDAGRAHGVLCLHPRTLFDQSKSKLDVILIGLNELLAQFGLFDLHAAALVRHEVGLLLVGGSCTGKSTTAVALACQGWSFLSDDTVLLRSTEPVAAHGFRTVFSVDPQLAEHLPELKGSLGAQVDSETGKHLLDMRSMLPHQYANECVPNRLVFTSIGNAAETVLQPLEPGKAMTLLMQQSPSLAFRRRYAQEQIALLGRLVAQSQNFMLCAGRDVHENPRQLEPLIADVVLSEGTSSTGRGR